jgi:hypothetical protein
MKRSPTLLCFSVSLAIACCVAGCSSSEDPEDAQTSVRDVLQEGRNSGGIENACLLAYAAQYDELLPLSLATAVTGLRQSRHGRTTRKCWPIRRTMNCNIHGRASASGWSA